MNISNKLRPFIAILAFFILQSNLNAQSDNQKILILTEYLTTTEGKTVEQARSEAIATVYGEPLLKNVTYDEQSETFFAKLISEKGNYVKDISFYMPYKKALKFRKDIEASRLDIRHAFKDNKIYIENIELNYDDVNYPLHVKETNSFTFKVGGYIVDSQETNLKVSKNGLGASVNFRDLLDMPENANIIRASAKYKFNAKHSLEFSYYSIDNDSRIKIDQELNWGDINVKAGAEVSSYFNTDIYKLNYNYSFYQTSKIDLLLRIGLHVTSIDTGFSANGNVDINGTNEYTEVNNVNITAPLPVLGLGLSYNFTPKLKLNYKTDYFFLTIQDLKGNMLDSLLSLDYKFNRYIGAGVGYNITNMNFDTDTDDLNIKVDHKVSGALVYLILSY